MLTPPLFFVGVWDRTALSAAEARLAATEKGGFYVTKSRLVVLLAHR